MNIPKVTNPMCAIEEYAISFFMSRCTNATKAMYSTAIKDSAMISQSKWRLASGAIGSENLKKPYPPIFSMMAANTTEPPVGASTCASGSQVCTGHIGTFTANAAKKAKKMNVCSVRLNGILWNTASS